jgi:hypothetical protein
MSNVIGAMKLVATSEPIDFSWYADIGDAVTAVVRKELEENPPRLDFPVGWDFGDDPSDGRSGPPPSDPVTLYLDLPFAESVDERVRYSCSLEDVVDDLIEGHVGWSSGKIEDEDGRRICARVAARLRELADKLDSACSGAAAELRMSNGPKVTITPESVRNPPKAVVVTPPSVEKPRKPAVEPADKKDERPPQTTQDSIRRLLGP